MKITIKLFLIYCFSNFLSPFGFAQNPDSLKWAYLDFYPWIWSNDLQDWVHAEQPALTTRDIDGEVATSNGSTITISQLLEQFPLNFRLSYPDISEDSILRIFEKDPINGTNSGTFAFTMGDGYAISFRCIFSVNESDNSMLIYCFEMRQEHPQTFCIQLNFQRDRSGEFAFLGKLDVSIGWFYERTGTFAVMD